MTINCNGKLVDLSTPRIMGILNITPDSFFDGGQHNSIKKALIKAEKMVAEGADFLDVGGYSSRPGADFVSEKDELARVVPVVNALAKEFPEVNISVDTFRSKVAKATIENGAALINDISAGDLDNNMMATVAKLQVPYIMMHMQGTPENMQQNPTYNNVITDIKFYLSKKIKQAQELHINDVIIDPGFGFGKTLEHNYTLLNNLELFSCFNLPLLVGISRKSMIYKPLNITPDLALNGTTALHMIALQKGATILRVHDIKEAKECIKLFNLLKQHNHD